LIFLALGIPAASWAADEPPAAPPVLLQMIRDDAVHDELGLDESQRRQVDEFLPTVDGPWFRARNLPAEKQQAEIEQLTTQLAQQLSKILRPQQLQRLQQLKRQALGTRMLLGRDVIEALKLTDQQTQALAAAFRNTDQQSAKIQQELQSGQLTAAAAEGQIEQLKTVEKQTVASQLADSQKQNLSALVGVPFDFGKVQRTYPKAPELTTEGAQWIQGGPLQLEDLRGKVVAVHFYAFQCVNCVRNLPHYKAWHADFADQDLVIIGIQTPETPSERDVEQVAKAAQAAGIEYPVLMDSAANNWKTWHNTMWPTVYLIDKQGFLRRWWQGELNWQSATGEQEFRQTIQQLLKE
jgi:peroxiredoxin